MRLSRGRGFDNLNKNELKTLQEISQITSQNIKKEIILQAMKRNEKK